VIASGQDWPLLDVQTEEHYVRDLVSLWPSLVENGWADEVQGAPRWWRAVRAEGSRPPAVWFHDHKLVLHSASHVYPPFETWWQRHISEVRAVVAEREPDLKTAVPDAASA
jgi:hypothetical protein